MEAYGEYSQCVVLVVCYATMVKHAEATQHKDTTTCDVSCILGASSSGSLSTPMFCILFILNSFYHPWNDVSLKSLCRIIKDCVRRRQASGRMEPEVSVGSWEDWVSPLLVYLWLR